MIGIYRYLADRFIRELESQIRSGSVVTTTFYGIVRSLLEKRKLFLRLNVWPGSGPQVETYGGYDSAAQHIRFIVRVRPDFDIESYMGGGHIRRACSSILAALAHEGMFLYNLRTDGKLMSHPYVVNWFKNYFAMSIARVTNRTTVARIVASKIDYEYPLSLFMNIEKPSMTNMPLRVREQMIGRRHQSLGGKALFEEYIIEGLSSIVGEDLPTALDIDQDSADALKRYMDEHVWLTYLLYKTRNLTRGQLTIDELRRDPALEAENDRPTPLWRGYPTGTQRPYLPQQYKYGMGFGEMANPKIFSTAYKNATGLRDVYSDALLRSFFRSNRVFSELYFPSTILGKVMYYAVRDPDATGEDVRLFSAVNDGLMYLL